MRRLALMGVVVAAAGLAAGGCRRAAAPVVRVEGVAVSRADAALALGRAAATPARGAPRPPERVLVDLVAEELLAREARALPGAAAAAHAAVRAAAIQLLLDQEGGAGARLDPRAYYQENQGEFTRPAQVRLAKIVVATCVEARGLKEALDARRLTFAAAAVRDSIDRRSAPAGGELGWQPEERLSRPLQRAIRTLAAPGAISEPVADEAGCVLVQLLERRPAVTLPFAAARATIERRLASQGRGHARRQLLARLGGSEGGQVRQAALEAAVSGRGDVGADDEVAVLGADRVTAGEVRAALGGAATGGPGGVARVGAKLLADLRLWQEARRRGLDRRPEVQAAERGALVGHLRAALDREVTAAAIPAAAVREVYDKALGDFTEPRRVRVSVMVSREREKAERWVRDLRAARYSTDAFDQLVARESEEPSARKTFGDAGWIDARSQHVAEVFRDAALALHHPGEVSGVIPAGGAYQVLLCRDLRPERVKPFAEVEGEIRERLVRQQRAERYEARVAAVRDRVTAALDAKALAAAVAQLGLPAAPPARARP
jgi:peptidyl-prolyl cis-trans isomerase C